VIVSTVIPARYHLFIGFNNILKSRSTSKSHFNAKIQSASSPPDKYGRRAKGIKSATKSRKISRATFCVSRTSRSLEM